MGTVDFSAAPGVEWVCTVVVETRESGGGVSELGFEAAFPELFDAGYRAAFRLLGSREDAAECAQEACARAFASWKRLSRRGDVVPWVVRVSGRLAIDRWRRGRRVPARGSVSEPNA